jgi:hypothetical protein
MDYESKHYCFGGYGERFPHLIHKRQGTAG